MEEERIVSDQEKAMDGDIFLCPVCGFWEDFREAIWAGIEEDPNTGEGLHDRYICRECAGEEY